MHFSKFIFQNSHSSECYNETKASRVNLLTLLSLLSLKNNSTIIEIYIVFVIILVERVIKKLRTELTPRGLTFVGGDNSISSQRTVKYTASITSLKHTRLATRCKLNPSFPARKNFYIKYLISFPTSWNLHFPPLWDTRSNSDKVIRRLQQLPPDQLW